MWREGEKARATQSKRDHEPLGEVTNMDIVAEKPSLITRSQKVLQSSDVMNTYRNHATPTGHLLLSRTQHRCQRPLSVVVEKVSHKTLLGRCENMNTVEPPRSGQSRPNIVRISEFHLVSHAKPVKRTKFLLSEIRTLVRHVYEYHASFYRVFFCFFLC